MDLSLHQSGCVDAFGCRHANQVHPGSEVGDVDAGRDDVCVGDECLHMRVCRHRGYVPAFAWYLTRCGARFQAQNPSAVGVFSPSGTSMGHFTRAAARRSRPLPPARVSSRPQPGARNSAGLCRASAEPPTKPNRALSSLRARPSSSEFPFAGLRSLANPVREPSFPRWAKSRPSLNPHFALKPCPQAPPPFSESAGVKSGLMRGQGLLRQLGLVRSAASLRGDSVGWGSWGAMSRPALRR